MDILQYEYEESSQRAVETPTYHYNNTPAINPNREADSPGQRWLKSS